MHRPPPVDGTTIAPLLDYWGNPPGRCRATAEPEAYVQYVNGLPWNWLTRSDMVYEPFRPIPRSIYGRAPLESIILNANTDIRFQLYFLQRFTEGNIPDAFASAPESVVARPDRAVPGLLGRLHVRRPVPQAPGPLDTWRQQDRMVEREGLLGRLRLFLMRKTTAAYHVVPSDLGFTEDVNRSSGESQADVQHRVGDLPLIRYIQGIITSFLRTTCTCRSSTRSTSAKSRTTGSTRRRPTTSTSRTAPSRRPTCGSSGSGSRSRRAAPCRGTSSPSGRARSRCRRCRGARGRSTRRPRHRTLACHCPRRRSPKCRASCRCRHCWTTRWPSRSSAHRRCRLRRRRRRPAGSTDPACLGQQGSSRDGGHHDRDGDRRLRRTRRGRRRPDGHGAPVRHRADEARAA